MVKILTATYNHCTWLPDLYQSLLEQTNKNFQWIIVDDGSSDETENCINDYINEHIIDILYIKKPNGGKGSATNIGLDNILDDDIVVIVDDDEVLLSNAIEIVESYYKKYSFTEENIGVINFQRRDKTTGNYFANYIQNVDMTLSYYDFVNRGYSMDGYIAYMGYAIKNFRFPIFDGEKYIGPSVLIMLCNNKYGMVYAKESLGESEYMPNGITNQGKNLRFKNPMGMIYRCVLQQNKRLNLKIRLKYSMMGFAYIFISHSRFDELIKNKIDTRQLNKLMIIPGYILSLLWKWKFK